MAATGALAPRSASTTSETGWAGNTWVTPENLYGAGTANITASTFDAGVHSRVLRAHNFDFSAIPNGSTIQGVQVVVGGAYYATAICALGLGQLLDTAGARVGTNQYATPVNLTTSPANYTKGGATDTWGNSLTAAWVKDPEFGVGLGIIVGASNNCDVFIDSVTMEVWYTAPPATRVADLGVNLAGCVVSAAATLVATAALAVQLTGATVGSGATVPSVADLGKTLAAATLESTATADSGLDERFAGLSVSLAGATVSSETSTPVAASASITLAGNILASGVAAEAKIDLAADLGGVSLSAASTVEAEVDLTAGMAGAALSAVVTVPVGADAGVTLSGATLSSTAAGGDNRTAELSATLAGIVLGAGGTVPVAGDLAGQLAGTTLSATTTGESVDERTADLDITLAWATVSATASVTDYPMGQVYEGEHRTRVYEASARQRVYEGEHRKQIYIAH